MPTESDILSRNSLAMKDIKQRNRCIRMEAEEKCPTCNGTGTCECQHYDDVQSCMTCLGYGVLRYRIKEEKAKEYARLEALGLEAQRFYDPNTSPEYYERLVETMEDIFEAGKQERDREIIEKLKDEFDERQTNSESFLDGMQAAITWWRDAIDYLIENLSK